MGLYEIAKDALKIAQKADNVELVQKILDVQQMSLDMQEKQQTLQTKLGQAENELKLLKDLKRFIFAEGHNYMIDENDPSRELCPVCTQKNGFATPLSMPNKWCVKCNQQYK